ncbi:unnamed protein product [Arabidopsis halleri]
MRHPPTNCSTKFLNQKISPTEIRLSPPELWDQFRLLREVSRSLENQWSVMRLFYLCGSFFVNLDAYST